MGYTVETKRSTAFPVDKMLKCPVLKNNESVPLKEALQGDATIMLFVRNGA